VDRSLGGRTLLLRQLRVFSEGVLVCDFGPLSMGAALDLERCSLLDLPGTRSLSVEHRMIVARGASFVSCALALWNLPASSFVLELARGISVRSSFFERFEISKIRILNRSAVFVPNSELYSVMMISLFDPGSENIPKFGTAPFHERFQFEIRFLERFENFKLRVRFSNPIRNFTQ